jgi:hypothetical protein
MYPALNAAVLTAGPDVILEAERTLDREVAEMLLLKAGRYLEEAKRIMATRS